MFTMLLRRCFSVSAAALSLGMLAGSNVELCAQTPARQLGTVKTIEGSTLTVVTKDGPVNVPVAPDAAVLSLAPGSTDLKTATAAKFSDISVGDKVLTGKANDTATASRIILMKSGDIAARNQAEQLDWQKRGTSGLVKSVEGASFTVTSGTKTIKVETTAKTAFRRYAGDSIKFQDAVPGELAQVHAGDQLSVRGDKSADGTSLTADEVVTGNFSNLSGLLSSIDATSNTVTLKDLTTKKTVVVKVTPNSDVRKLPAQMAAAFTGGGRPAGAAGAGSPGGGGRPASDGGSYGGPPRGADGSSRVLGDAGAGGAGAGSPGIGSPGAGSPGAGAAGGSRRTGMDLSRMLSRLPTESVADLHPNDAVMIVASPGPAPGAYTAITLLSGVEALLTAPAGAQPITLSPWNIGGGGGGGGPE